MSAPNVTLTETMQVKFNRKNCPFLDDCDKRITHEFFKVMCMSTKFPGCLWYALRMDEAYTPFSWLQKSAIASMPQTENTDL